MGEWGFSFLVHADAVCVSNASGRSESVVQMGNKGCFGTKGTGLRIIIWHFMLECSHMLTPSDARVSNPAANFRPTRKVREGPGGKSVMGQARGYFDWSF